jgi:hypothetical protein
MKTEIVETNILIAERVPPGDRWEVTNVDEIQPSLTDALNAYYMMVTNKPQAYRIEPLNGKLYAIKEQEQEVKEPEIKRYNIYGDPI